MQVIINADENCSKEMGYFLNQDKAFNNIDKQINKCKQELEKIKSGIKVYDFSDTGYINAMKKELDLKILKSERQRIEYSIVVTNCIVTLLRKSTVPKLSFEEINNIIKRSNKQCENCVVLDSLFVSKKEVNILKNYLNTSFNKENFDCIVPIFKKYNNKIIITDFKTLECYSTKELWEIAHLI